MLFLLIKYSLDITLVQSNLLLLNPYIYTTIVDVFSILYSMKVYVDDVFVDFVRGSFISHHNNMISRYKDSLVSVCCRKLCYQF